MRMADADDLKNMVMSFRVSELQMLLGFAGRNKTGRKNELQARALELVRTKSTPIHLKIRELFKTIQQGHGSGLNTLTGKSDVSSSSGAAGQGGPQSAAMNKNYAAYSTDGRSALQTRSAANSNPYLHPYGNANAAASTSANRPIAPMYASAASGASNAYPVHPDVRLRHLPFYKVSAELVKPTTLVPQGAGRFHESTFQFHLTPQQATDIASSRDLRPGSKMDFHTQVQLRFCLLETSCEQDDCFPPSICVKVNGKMCQLPNPIPTNRPGVEPKRPPRPVNVTPLVKLSPTVANHITVTWTAEFGRSYTASAYLVQRLTSADLLAKLRGKGVRHADVTRGLIKEKLKEDADCEIATTSLRVTLACPLGKMRMQIPCRASTCGHLQCFDASLYLQMNERKPTWICPVCNRPALFGNLVIDGYFQEVLSSALLQSNDGNEVQLHGDGSWSPLIIKKEHSVSTLLTPKQAPRVETVPEEILDSPSPQAQAVDSPQPVSSATTLAAPAAAQGSKRAEVIDLTLSDSDNDDGGGGGGGGANDDDDDAGSGGPPAKRATYSLLGRKDSYSLGGGGNSNSSSVSSVSSAANNTTAANNANNTATSSSSSSSSSGVSTVSSSTGPAGCASPHVITLDSPSSSPPPVHSPVHSPQVHSPQVHSPSVHQVHSPPMQQQPPSPMLMSQIMSQSHVLPPPVPMLSPHSPLASSPSPLLSYAPHHIMMSYAQHHTPPPTLPPPPPPAHHSSYPSPAHTAPSLPTSSSSYISHHMMSLSSSGGGPAYSQPFTSSCIPPSFLDVDSDSNGSTSRPGSANPAQYPHY